MEQAEIRVKHRQGSGTRQVKQRGDPKTVSENTYQGRSREVRITINIKKKLTHIDWMLQGGGVTYTH